MNPFVGGMVLIRLLSATIEVTAAMLMARYNRVDTALRINGVLGLVGPAVLLAATTLGLAGLADRLPVHKTLMIATGVLLIIIGTR
ncbi:MAG TPA: YqhV family protein [Bacillota bacterium]